jgi:broad specificity phosphatase PhoE
MNHTIYIARHGQTTWNLEVRVQGQEDVQLSRDGYRQRRGLYYLLKDRPIQRIFTSAMRRTILTAAPLAGYLNLALESTPDLNEISLGLLEGESLKDCDAWAEETWTWWLEDPLHHRVPGGGESYLDVFARVDRFLSRNPFQDGGETLIVGHFRVNQVLLSRLLGLPPEGALDICQPNQLVYQLDFLTDSQPEIDHTCTTNDGQPDWEPGLVTSARARGPYISDFKK